MAHTEFELLDQLEEELLEGEPEEEAAEVELLLPSSPVQYAASVLRGLSSGSERAAVRRAVASGQRDENALTNLVFFARHPERGGCRPARSEPGFVPLSKEWIDIRDRLVRPVLAAAGVSRPKPATTTSSWARQLMPLLNLYRGDIPLEFLLGWIDVESGGHIDSSTTLKELGYFQIHPDEWKERISAKFPGRKFEELSTDPDFSVRAGIMLVEGNRNAVTNSLQQLGFKPGPDLFWYVVKLWHWSPLGIDVTLRHMKQNGFCPSNWDEFRNYMCSNQMEIMQIMRRRLGFGPGWPQWCEGNVLKCGFNPKRGIENVEKVFKRGPELIGKPGVPEYGCR
jgi:hypothetical protein